MNEKEKVIAPLLTAMMLGELANSSYPAQTRTKERTIRKCANPKKKAARKTKQASQRRNRR